MNDHLQPAKLLVRVLVLVEMHNVWTTAVAQAKQLEMSREMAHKTVPKMESCSCSNHVQASERILVRLVLVS